MAAYILDGKEDRRQVDIRGGYIGNYCERDCCTNERGGGWR